ncbi:MAG: amidohydrolase family protein, partial [Endomicrobia bacterium]|nr:amidohydrolase family protein [Endomicrobiia bacterium]
VVSCGHSDATFADMQNAYKNGARSTTHLFNAMRPLHHREPGIVGFVLHQEDYYTEIIPDGVHVSPVLVSLVAKIKPDHLILVTDTMIGPKLDREKYILDGREIFIKSDRLVLNDGTLAGSMLGYNTGVKNLAEWCRNLSPQTVVKLSSYNAAKLLKLTKNKGEIANNKDADLIVVSKNWELLYTIIRGRISYTHH